MTSIKNIKAYTIILYISIFLSFKVFSQAYDKQESIGKVTFDYSDNNGRYFIGSGDARFEIKFTSASNNSIHVYNDPKSIDKIALAYDTHSFINIGDVRELNYSSRTRTPQTKEIVILVNYSGNYAAIKIEHVRARSHGAKKNSVTFSYQINGKNPIYN